MDRVGLTCERPKSRKGDKKPIAPRCSTVSGPIADTLPADHAGSWCLEILPVVLLRPVAGTESIAVHTELAGPYPDPPSVFAVCVVADT
jgi:hypothetical protein